MTRDELKQKVDAIIALGEGLPTSARVGRDDEAAHADEDRLRIELIEAFCPKWVVAEVDRLRAADFGRYCA